MTSSSNADHFFQTSSSLVENERKQRKAANTAGDPVAFSSKILAVHIDNDLDPSGDSVFVAEAGGQVSSVQLSSGSITKIGPNAQVPVTCLASFAGRKNPNDIDAVQHVFAGDWNKNVRDLQLRSDSTPLCFSALTAFKAHTDFVKCLCVARAADGQLVLLTGGADGEVNIWSFAGHRYATIKPQSRGIESICVDPLSDTKTPVIFFSTSQRDIYSFILPSTTEMRGIQLSGPILQHETSVYKLYFDNDGDLWTASADKTAKRLVRATNWTADTTLTHPDFVRDIVVYEPSSLVITACRDEDVRVWHTGSGQLMHTFIGHYEEVTGLALSGHTLVSVSIDGTLRRWSLAPSDLRKAIEEAKNPNVVDEETVPPTDFGLTEEEEAELRALMEDQEAESHDKIAVDEQ